MLISFMKVSPPPDSLVEDVSGGEMNVTLQNGNVFEPREL